MSIRQAEEDLFTEWQMNRDDFIRDGVVCEKYYLESKPKIVLILKEVNGGKNWDLREFLLRGGRAQTWNNVSRWLHGIRNRHAIPAWNYYKRIKREFRQQQLRSICVMNLKKEPGGAAADYGAIRRHAVRDAEFIRRQYGIYDPGLTICGGTGDLFREVVGHGSNQWHETHRGIKWYKTTQDKYVVKFSHPSARTDASFLLYGLLDAVNELANCFDAE